MKKFFRSLLAKYMFIILMAISLIQIIYVLVALLVSGIAQNMDKQTKSKGILDTIKIEQKWHDEANKIKNVSPTVIDKHFAKWKKHYPEASMFWVDGNGILLQQVDVKEKLPSQWTSGYTTKFIKEHYDGDPFTVIAFAGKDETNGFLVIEIPRSRFDTPITQVYDKYGFILVSVIIFIIFLFIAVSFLFFRTIRKRLVQLQAAITIRDVDGLPVYINVKKKDEIGQLEKTFNKMVFELKKSKQREGKEEQIRRELIANLSHDLRTPLTKIRAQTYSVGKEELSREGKLAIKALETSITNIDRLIGNLMSYTLLMASKYKFEQKEIDIVRFVRESLATWYPAFEKEGFDIDIELHPFKKTVWTVDPVWLGRILDNLFQNVLRHAKNGQYIGVKTEATDTYDSFIVIDHGKGIKNESNQKGAGIGLSIVDMMVKGMNLDWDMESSEHGTTIKIKKSKMNGKD